MTLSTASMNLAMDLDQAHFNMLENQIRAGGVRTETILNTLTAVRREHFVPHQYRNLAFADMEIPLPHGETMLKPQVEALILEAAAVTPQDSILEVGAGSGYMAALLAHQADQVTTIEIEPGLVELAEKNLKEYGIKNAQVVLGNGAQGWRKGDALYDVIVISGSLIAVPPIYIQMLHLGGRLLAFVGEPPYIKAQLIQRITESEYKTTTLFETSVKPLREQAPFSHFRF